jgi:hypothetical protein
LLTGWYFTELGRDIDDLRLAAVAVDEAITKWKNPKPIQHLVQDLVSDGITNIEQRHLVSDGITYTAAAGAASSGAQSPGFGKTLAINQPHLIRLFRDLEKRQCLCVPRPVGAAALPLKKASFSGCLHLSRLP